MLAAIAAVLVSGCARDPVVSTVNAVPAGKWRIERQTDRITGAPLASAFLMTRTVANSKVVFPQPAMLQLLCFKKNPAVRFAFPFQVGSTRNSVFGYRFDDRPGHEPSARFLADFKTVVIEDPAEVAQFTNELATSASLYVLVRSLNAGRSSAEFSLEGAPVAISAAFAECPVQTAKPADAPAARKRAGAR